MKNGEEILKTFWENSVTGIAIVSQDGSFITANSAMCRFLGYSESELQKLTYQDLTHPQDVDDDVEMARRIATGDISWYEMDKRYITKSGRVVWCALRVSAVRDRDGKFLVYVSQVSPFEPTTAQERNIESKSKTRWLMIVNDWKFVWAVMGSAIYLISEAWKNWRNH